MNKHLKSLHAPGAEERKRGRAPETNGVDPSPKLPSRKKNMSLNRPHPPDGVREELLTDSDLFVVITRLEARGAIPGVTAEDEEAVRHLRETINRSHPERRAVAEADDIFDERVAGKVPPDPIELAHARYGGPTDTIPLLSRSRWQVRYIMAKAKLMLVEEENVMRRTELATLLEQERRLVEG